MIVRLLAHTGDVASFSAYVSHWIPSMAFIGNTASSSSAAGLRLW